MNKTICLLLLPIVLLYGCSEPIAFEVDHNEEIIVNGMICPDSSISIHLSKSIPPTAATAFPNVDNAQITVFENNTEIGTTAYRGSGYYQLDYLPKVNHTYRIEVAIDGHPTIEAEDTVPELVPDFTARHIYAYDTTVLDNGWSVRRYQLYTVTFETPLPKPSWLGGLVHAHYFDHDSIYQASEKYFGYNFQSIDPYFDQKRGEFDSYTNTYGYGDFSPILPAPASYTYAFEFGYQTYQREYSGRYTRYDLTASVVNGSTTYDQYLQSYIASKKYEPDPEDWFPFGQSTQLYSNIKNANGIFAAYTVRQVAFPPLKDEIF
ncbi:DUF4249 family protein [Algivirga pacifica]|uniref:DUF4249 domain-containing protein n=1 Tax=Algivirga pacifica TaxID=1162670 RepID=A0ABP9D6Y5_9BACT